MHNFCAREINRFRQQSCVLLCKKIRMNNDHTAHWSMIGRCDIDEPHVALLCEPRFEWVILREDSLAHQAPFRSKSYRSVPRIELQVKRQLVRTRTVRSNSNVHQKFPVLPFRSASAKSKLSIVVVSDDILNSYFHSPGSYRGTDNSSCLRKTQSTTCSSDSRGGRVLDTGSSFTMQIPERSGSDGGIGTNTGVPSVGVFHTDAASIILWSVLRVTSRVWR